MASLTDGRNGLAAGGIALERGDDLDGGERLGASRFRRQVGADEFGGRSVAPMGLHDGVDVEGLPEAGLAITDPPFGEVGLSELLVQRKLDHRAGGFGAACEGERGEVALELVLVQLAREQAGADLADGGSRVQAPGQPGISRRPFERGLGHDLGDGGMDFGLAVRGTEADGLEVSAVLSVELLGDRHKRGDGGRGLEITQRDCNLATHSGGLVLGHGFAEREDVAIGGTQGAESDEATSVVRRSEFRTGERGSLVAQLREQPDGAGGDVRIRVGQQGGDIVDDLVASGLEAVEATGTDVRRRAAQRGELSGYGVEINLGHDRLEALRSDSVDGTRQAVVAGAVTAHAGVEPIGDVDGAIWADRNVGGTELGLQDAGGLAAEEIGTRPLLLLVGSEEVKALELHAGTIGLGQIAEDDVLAGFTGEKQAVPLGIKRTVLIEGHAGRRAAAVDVARRHGAGVILAPFCDRSLLAGALVGTPRTLAVGRSEAGVTAFHDQRDAAGRRIVVVALVHVAKRVDGLFEAVAVIVADDAGVGAVAVHAHGEATDPDIAVIAAQTGHLLGIHGLLGELTMVIGAADTEGLAGPVGELRAGVALVEVPLAVGTEGRAVERVVMVAAVEAGEQDFPLVDLGIEDAIAVDVGVDNQVRRLRDDDLAVDVRHAERRDEIVILGEDRDLVGFAGAGRVFKDHDPVAFWTAAFLAAVVDTFGDIHPAVFVEIDVGRIEDLRRSGPDRDLETFGHREEFGRDERRSAFKIDRLVLLRTGREDRELHVGRTGLTATDGAAVIDADLGTEGLRWTREIKGDEGAGMRADAAGIGLPGDLEGFAVVVLTDAGGTSRFGFLPLEFGEIDHRAVGQDDFGFDPVRPVAGIAVHFGDHQEELLRAAELGRQLDQALLVLGIQDGGFGDRLRGGGGYRSGEA